MSENGKDAVLRVQASGWTLHSMVMRGGYRRKELSRLAQQREDDILEALQHMTPYDLAFHLGVKPGTLYAILSRHRRRSQKSPGAT